MHRILCSTGALIGRPNGRDYHLLADCDKRLACDGFELMMYDSWYEKVDELAAFLRERSLRIPVMHCEKRIGESISRRAAGDWDEAFCRFEVNCQLAAFLGARLMVMHLWDGLLSDTKFENNLEAYAVLRRIAARHGVVLTVENVVCAADDPMTHFRSILERDAAAAFTWDTKMAAFHGQTESAYAPENRFLWAHIRHLHINDYAGGYRDWDNLRTLHVGKGSIDFERLFFFLKTIGYQGDYTVEATSFLPDGVIRWEELNETFSKIRAYLS